MTTNDNSNYVKQYLLKSKGGSTAITPDNTEECTPGETQTERCDDFYVTLPVRYPMSTSNISHRISNAQQEKICTSEGKWDKWTNCHANVWVWLGDAVQSDVKRPGVCHSGKPQQMANVMYYRFATYGGDDHGGFVGCNDPQYRVDLSTHNYNTEDHTFAHSGAEPLSVCGIYQCREVTPYGYAGSTF